MHTGFWIPAMFAVALAVAAAPAVAQYKIIQQVWVKVPDRAPNGDFWDTAIGGILTLRPAGLLPDIRVCIASARVPVTCAPFAKTARNARHP